MKRRVSLACLVIAVAGIVLLHAESARSDDDENPRFNARVSGSASAGASAGAGGAKSGGCAEGMIEVDGDYCSDLPEQKCLRFASNTTKARCAEFAPSEACPSAPIHKHFCIDKFEYPNRAGENPLVMKNWFEAREMCVAQNKRLCGDSEWTLACEGAQRLPYPYGLQRDATACNIDKAPINPHEEDLRNFQKRDAEAKRLWQGEPSGSRDRCKSSFGVQDMTGNVDEWVVNEKGKPHHSGLKGGYWSYVRGRCRPLTDGHEEDFRYYQIGFRCCSETSSAVATRGSPQ